MTKERDIKKLDRWAEKLLDTGKRNNLINFRDSKTSTAEVVFPDCQRVFSKCSVGHVFEVYDPKIVDDDLEEPADSMSEEKREDDKLSREEYIEKYSSRIKGDKKLLIYSQTPNPVTAVKNIYKKSEQMLDETGLSVAYLAFGFIRWKEKENSKTFFRAPLLLVHCRVLTGSILDPVRIEISDDDVVVNPTFNYLLQADYGLKLPEYEDGESLTGYFQKISRDVQKMGWEVQYECKLGIFSFLKINMYEDLKKNAQLILKNKNIQTLFGNAGSKENRLDSGGHVVENPLIDLHTVVDADSSQIEAIEMAKSGKSFVLQGPPGTGKSQTITNIIAECLHDGKKVLFVSEKQAALNVVFEKLKKADLADFCLELHSHKANKKAVIQELNRTLEMPKSLVSSSVQDEIRQKRAAQLRLDGYADALHKKRRVINKSLYQLYELYSAQRKYPDVKYSIKGIQKKDQNDLLHADRLLEQYAEYVPTIGQNFKENAWYGFTKTQLSFDDSAQLKEDLQGIIQIFGRLRIAVSEIRSRYEVPVLCYDDTKNWQNILSRLAVSDAITPALLSKDSYRAAVPYLLRMKELSEKIIPIRERLYESFSDGIIEGTDGEEIFARLTGEFASFFSRLFSSDYKGIFSKMQLHYKGGKLKYQTAVDGAALLKQVQDLLKEYKQEEEAVKGCIGECYCGPDTDWEEVFREINYLQSYHDRSKFSFGKLSEMSTPEFQNNQEAFKEKANELQEEIEHVEDEKDRIQQYFSTDVLDLNQDSYEDCLLKADRCLSRIDQLRNWIGFMELRNQIEEAGLSSFGSIPKIV